jgi:nitroreductase
MTTLPSSAGGPPGPEQATTEDVAAFVVAAAVWAPSVHNTQPWQFSARGQQISLHADASRQLMVWLIRAAAR